MKRPIRSPAPGEHRSGPQAGLDLTTGHPAVRLALGLVTAVAVTAVGAAHRDRPVVAGLLSLVVLVYGALSIIDVAEQRLPNRITLPLAGAASIAVLGAGALRADPESAVGALAVGLAFALALMLLRFGMGDVKLALTVGTIAGWLGGDAVLVTAYVGAGCGAVAAMVLLIVHRRRDLSFSFGPFLAVGSVAGMVVAGL